MKTISIEMSYIWDTEIDTDTAIITVPDDVTTENVIAVIKHQHDILDSYDDYEDDNLTEDLYGDYGRCMSTLMDYICSYIKPDWSWNTVDAAIDLE